MRTTSLIAHKLAEKSGLKHHHYSKIMRVLEKKKSGTSLQISKWSGLDYVAVARRMGELEKKGKVFSKGKIGLSPSKKPAMIWEIYPEKISSKLFK